MYSLVSVDAFLCIPWVWNASWCACLCPVQMELLINNISLICIFCTLLRCSFIYPESVTLAALRSCDVFCSNRILNKEHIPDMYSVEVFIYLSWLWNASCSSFLRCVLLRGTPNKEHVTDMCSSVYSSSSWNASCSAMYDVFCFRGTFF